MENILKKKALDILSLFLFFGLLFFSKEAMTLASTGLLIWYQKMIPSLFPFMVLSGYLVRSRAVDRFSILLKPFLGILFPFGNSMLYAIFIGFLCGFPMGAKVVCDLWQSRQITTKQGQFLLAFCNNIGPLYLLGYVFPLFRKENTVCLLGLFYAVPLLYGWILQYLPPYKHSLITSLPDSVMDRQREAESRLLSFRTALESALTQITLLGGCMIFFNCLRLYPEVIEKILPTPLSLFYREYLYSILCCLLEIGGGLLLLAKEPGNPSCLFLDPTLLFLPLLTFGGLSCIMQTAFILKDTELSVKSYIRHKVIQSILILMISFFF